MTTISTPGPIYWQSHKIRHPDVHDIYITKIQNYLITNIINLNDLSSDHLDLGAKAIKLSRP